MDKRQFPVITLLVCTVAIIAIVLITNNDSISLPVPDIVGKTYENASVVIIEESAERSEPLITLMDDRDWWAELMEKGYYTWNIMDINLKSAESYREKASEIGLPALLVLSEDGELLLGKPLPNTIEELEDDLNNATGL